MTIQRLIKMTQYISEQMPTNLNKDIEKHSDIKTQDDSHQYEDSDLSPKIELKNPDTKQPHYSSIGTVPGRINIHHVTEKIIILLATVLYLPKEQIVVNKNVSDMGIDSILGVELIRKINSEFNLNLSAIKLYDYPTVEKMTQYISEQMPTNVNVSLHKENEEHKEINRPIETNKIHLKLKAKPCNDLGLIISEPCDVYDLKLRSVNIPEPSANEVQIEVKASR